MYQGLSGICARNNWLVSVLYTVKSSLGISFLLNILVNLLFHIKVCY